MPTSGNFSFQHQKSSLHSLCCHLKHLLLELNETESASKMDKAQCQEIKPLSCWRVQCLAPITRSNPASPDSSARSFPSLLWHSYRAGSSFLLPWLSCIFSLPRNHVADAASASSEGLQGADRGKQLQFLLKKLCPGSSSSEFLWTETSARSWSSLSVCWGGDLKDKLSHEWTVPHGIVIYGAASCKEADK